MRSTFNLVILFMISAIPLRAQLTYEHYDWEEKPVLHTLTPEESKEPEIILKDKGAVEFGFSDKGDLVAFTLSHKIIRVNSNDAIENNNKIYLPYSNASEIVSQKARAITSTGRIINLTDSDIQEAKDEETQSTYRYFAIQGLDVGSEVEYFYLMRTSPNIMGSRRVMQSDVPKKDIDYEIISPKNLIFKAKSYNGLPELVRDTTVQDKNVLKVHVDAIPALKEQGFSNVDANYKMLVYKLDGNTYTGKYNLVQYSAAAANVYSNIYQELSKSAEKKLDKLVDDMQINASASEEQKVRTIESYLKTKFAYVEGDVQDLDDLADVIDNKVADDDGNMRLYTAVFTKEHIDHQIVLTTDRYDMKFDPDFEAFNFLQSYLIYFPKLNMYIDPAGKFSRLGFIASNYENNYGLFIKPVEVGDFKSGVGKVKFIEAQPYTRSGDEMHITVQFPEDITTPSFHLRREFTGYYAEVYQPYYDYLDDKQKKELTDQLVKFMSQDAEITKVELENEGGDNFPVKPFIVDAEFTSGAFIEKAGPKYLFKAGLLIGPQTELYQDEVRTMEAENDFNRRYHRTLKFNIPEGYTCKNLDDLTFDITQDIDGERTTQFVSHYTVKGNMVEVEIEEFYANIIYSLDNFEAFRKVVNAAADFNKVVLIFEKV